MTIAEIALAVACVTGGVAGADEDRTPRDVVTYRRPRTREEQIRENERLGLELLEKLRTTQQTPEEDPLDTLLRRLHFGDLRQPLSP